MEDDGFSLQLRHWPVWPTFDQIDEASGSGSMAPFGIWEQNLEPVFSESLKDPVAGLRFAH